MRISYIAYFESTFRYGLILCRNYSRIKDIVVLQNKVVRLINGRGGF